MSSGKRPTRPPDSYLSLIFLLAAKVYDEMSGFRYTVGIEQSGGK